MTPVDTAFERLRRANPEPDPEALLALVTAPDVTGSGELHRSGPVNRSPITSRLRVAWAGLATFGGGLVMGLVLLSLISGAPPAGWLQPTPVEIAERYFEAHNRGDAEAAKLLLAVDAKMVGPRWVRDDLGGVSWLDGLSQVFAYNRIVGLTYTPGRCTEAGTGDPVTVACDYQLDSVFQETAGVPPLPGRFFFQISDGLIHFGSDNFPLTEYYHAWDEWPAWLADHHPDDYQKLLGIPPSRAVNFWFAIPLTETLTPEMLDLLEKRIAEYANR